MNLKSLSALGAGLLLAACSQAPRTDSLTQYVDMRIGTGGHGHVFMGANVPYGAVQLGPTSIPQSWDWTSGYHISDTTVIGFSHTHLNGTGIGDLFDVTVMPVVGQVTYARGTEDDRSRACGRISATPMKRPARAITPRGSTATASTWS